MDLLPWNELLFRPDPGAAGGAALFELYHENSKQTRFDGPPSRELVAERMARLAPSLCHEGLAGRALPDGLAALSPGLAHAVRARASAMEMRAEPLSLAEIACLLACGYGVVERPDPRADMLERPERPLRPVPSGGALYPLELYLVQREGGELAPGLHHYEPPTHLLRALPYGVTMADVERTFLQPTIPANASLVLLITAVFGRASWKYGERAYRLALLEAGHVAQNVLLAVADLGLAAIPVIGFLDHEIDGLLRIDGVQHGILYSIAVGRLPSPPR
jgi:SagB-type dehydrogenase family enzyme